MVQPAITIGAELVRVRAGAETRVEVIITNPGQRVEGYRLEVLGTAAAWARVEPAEVSVYPQQTATAAVVVSPPDGASVAAGTYPLGVIARSTLETATSAVAESVVEIMGAAAVQATLVPINSSGRLGGQHRVELSNTGNTAADMQLSASDPDELLDFHVGPTRITVPPGGKSVVWLLAKPKKLALWGSATRKPFRVMSDASVAGSSSGGAGTGARVVVEGAFNQKPLFSTLVLGILAAVLALLIGGIAYLQSAAGQGPSPETLAPRPAPARPQLTLLSADVTSAVIRWQAVEGADSYDIQMVDCETGDGKGSPRNEPNSVTQITVDQLRPADTSCLHVRARGASDSAWSEVLVVETAPEPPPTPEPAPKRLSTPKLVRGKVTTTTAEVRWDTVDGTGYYELQWVECGSNDGLETPWRESDATNKVTLTDLKPSSTSCLRMRARGAADKTDSKWSKTLKIETPVELPEVLGKNPLLAARGTPDIDGYYGESAWFASEEFSIDSVVTGTSDVYASGRLLWDDDALYLGVYVYDPTLDEPDRKKKEKLYEGDSVILELGPDIHGVRKEDLARTEDAYYMFGFSRSAPPIGVLGPTKARTSFDVLRKSGDIRAKITVNEWPGGGEYYLEAAIPWRDTNLGGPPESGMLAANVLVSDKGAGMKSTNPQRTLELRAHPAYWRGLVLQY